MRIIPAIDIINGNCVRLTKGDYSTQKIYSENPLEMAKRFEDMGVEYLHLVDLDGAIAQQIVNYKTLELIALKTNLKIDFSGGIKTEKDVDIAFNSGASQITVGSIAAQNPELMLTWLSKYAGNNIILGADCKNRQIATNGWLQTTEYDVVSFIKSYQEKGATYAIVTDIDKDGMLNGPATGLYADILTSVPSIKLIASGGISSMNDIQNLKKLGCEAAIIGKAIYEGAINLEEVMKVC